MLSFDRTIPTVLSRVCPKSFAKMPNTASTFFEKVVGIKPLHHPGKGSP